MFDIFQLNYVNIFYLKDFSSLENHNLQSHLIMDNNIGLPSICC